MERPRGSADTIAARSSSSASPPRGYLAWLVVSRWSQLDRAVLRFQGAGGRWLAGAVGLEVLAQGCQVVVQHRLLRRAGASFGILATVRLALAQNAIAMAVPGGQAVASVFSYRQIRRRGANAPVLPASLFDDGLAERGEDPHAEVRR